jgi:hydroxymethylpyrimidine pyrophosphatase-like HAD family hydrolase
MKTRKVIAIDFDGTITEDSPFPITGRVRPEAIEVIKKLQERYICVLWTCRRGPYLLEAIELLEQNGVIFEFVNSTPFPERSSNKIYADVYIDDRSINTKIDWYEIERTLLGDK